jgi:hypothetical protein
MTKTLHGNIFAVPLPDGTYICGRVLLDVRAIWKQRLLPHDSPLLYANSKCLVEMYSQVQSTPDYLASPLLVAGIFVDASELGKSWPLIGNEPVYSQKVEFPETLIGFHHPKGESAFECGEISVPLSLTEKEIHRMGLGVFKSSYSAFLWPFACWRLLGHEDSEIPENARGVRSANPISGRLAFGMAGT